ncbi:hypothetical protein B0T24DRAFT_288187 [Lasiosphaeria ovina]|uniref:Uncharacterized protein n=1 Tax=Lasiosphaeria ovina TaxID=92902 RepID=A0AAE0KDV2_9PEZI|nr:hypothetical protein B0T24DRAFT_288187 [Lasiosphaeria ovina]
MFSPSTVWALAAAATTAAPRKRLRSIVGSFSVFYLPAVLQLPTLIMPIGQKPYDSRISGLKEYPPIVSSFMGAKGSDLLLLVTAPAHGRPQLAQGRRHDGRVRGRGVVRVGGNLSLLSLQDALPRPEDFDRRFGQAPAHGRPQLVQGRRHDGRVRGRDFDEATLCRLAIQAPRNVFFADQY